MTTPYTKLCETLVAEADTVEAAFILSSDGLTRTWYTRRDTAVDDVASVSAGLLGIARELDLFDTTSDASMLFETGFGAMYLHTIDRDTLLVLCLLRGYSFLTINRLLQNVLPGIT
jgi:predicted regulator of Ras-like GTPase activity (Roadblock/LC7/MglB family)